MSSILLLPLITFQQKIILAILLVVTELLVTVPMEEKDPSTLLDMSNKVYMEEKIPSCVQMLY
jgi:hypothetical protein